MAFASGSARLPEGWKKIDQSRAALVVLAVGLVISFVAWRSTEERVGGDAARKFQYRAAQAVDTVDRRFQDNINLLLGLKGLFAASEQVDRDEFQRYLTSLNPAQRYAGLRLVSFARRVPHAEKAAFEESVRRDKSVNPSGYPKFAIRPPGDRDEYLVVTYLEPMAGNETAFGLDVLSVLAQRPELERARDGGQPVGSSPIPLLADPQKRISLLMRVPVYRKGMPAATVAQRRVAFLGQVTAAIQVDEFMNSLLGRQLGTDFEIVIHDLGISGAASRQQAPSADNLIFDSRRQRGAKAGAGGIKQESTLEVGGRKWLISFSAPAGAYGIEQALPLVVLLGGIMTSFLLFWLIWALSASRERALKIAEQVTSVRAAEVLREQLGFIQQLIEAVPQPIFFKDAAARRYLGVNKAWEKFFGIPREQFVGKTVFELYPDNQELAEKHHARDQELFASPGSQSYEAAIVAADGSVHHTIYNKATFNNREGNVAGLIGTITDVTGLKEAEAALRESEARFRGLTELSTDWYWEQDADFRFTRIEGRTAGVDPVTTREFLMGKTRWEAAAEPLAGTWDDHRRQLEARQPFYDFEMRVVDGSGRERFLSTSGRPFFGVDGKFQGYRGTARDITARKREERLLRLEHSITRCLAEAESASVGLKTVIRIMCEALGWPCGRYFYADEGAGVLRFGEAWHAPGAAVESFIAESRSLVYRPGHGLSGQVWESGQPLWSSEASKDPRASGTSRRSGSALGVALVFPVMSQGRTIGVLSLCGHDYREPDERLLDAIRVIGSQIGQFLQRKQAEVVLHQSEARFRDLTELSSDWYWEQDENLRFTLFSSKLHDVIPNADRLIGMTRWETAISGVSEEQWQAHKALLAAHQPFRDFVYQRHDTGDGLRTISVSGRPIFDEQGRFQGYRGTGRDITEQKRADEQIRHMAQHDTLTGLPNRALLLDRIGQAIAQAQRKRGVLALLFIDLDRFKTVNDSLGHQVGDHLLQSVAERLEACMRGSDTVARIGGDEFVVLLGDLEMPEDARHVAQKVLDALSEPVMIDTYELKITPSVGICVYPHDGENVEILMRSADTAMYHAKQMGRNNYQFFTQAMNDAAQQRLLLENDLRHAQERGEFTLHYQPLLDLDSGTIVGFEALIRWPHSQRGMIPPSLFIPVAEETGLIIPIGEWVLRRACSQARAWHEAGYSHLQVSVNCSAQQFQREDFVETVARVLRETGLPAGRLDLEITESMIVQHSEEVMARFEALDGMGVRISIDDFGTGYSSLSYLKRFPIHQLKIDQSFVRDIGTDPDDAAIVSAIIAIAHSLRLEVVAEGVETPEQLAFLRALGCARAQGYYFSKPLPAEAFTQLLGGWRQRAYAAAGA